MAQRVYLILLFGLLLGVGAATSLRAQELTFCLDHTENGLPLGSGKYFELERFGQNVELLFRNHQPIRTEKLYFFIDYQQEGKFSEFDTKTMAVDHNKTWVLLPYRFSQTGKYRVVVLDSEKKEICRSEVDVVLKEEENSPEYFQGATLQFCRSVRKGVPDTLIKFLKLPPGEAGALTLLLRHVRPFKTLHIYVDVWVGSGLGAGQYLETLEFSLDPNWAYSQFAYTFRSAGVYTFRIYNEDEIWVTSASIEVTVR